MANTLRIHAWAYDDARAAFNWYAGLSAALGNKFSKDLKATFKQITLRPDHSAFYRKRLGIRFATTRKFRYVVFFRQEGDVVHVLGIFHPARSPRRWLKRIRDVDPP